MDFLWFNAKLSVDSKMNTPEFTLDGNTSFDNFSKDFYIPWTEWTPTLAVSGGTPPTYDTRFVSRYSKIGKIVFCTIDWANTTGGVPGVGANTLTFTLPLPAVNPNSTSITIGNGWSSETGATANFLNSALNSNTTQGLFYWSNGAALVGNDQSGDARYIYASLVYETF